MYLFFKLLHVFAVIAFLGNIAVGVFWKEFADRTKDAKVMAFALDGIIRADRIFTIPGVIAIVIGGVGAAMAGGFSILGTGWILWGLSLFIISGIAFGPLSRAQRELLAAARAGDMQRYDQLSKRWNLYGGIALIAPVLAAAIMILKPALPAFH